jgi:hypothetical protein
MIDDLKILNEELPPISTIFNRAVISNVQKEPVKIIEEHHENDFVKISIFEKSGRFVYDYQFKIAKLIRQKISLPLDVGNGSINDAQSAAWNEIIKICSENRAKRAVLKFCYNQMELSFYSPAESGSEKEAKNERY